MWLVASSEEHWVNWTVNEACQSTPEEIGMVEGRH